MIESIMRVQIRICEHSRCSRPYCCSSQRNVRLPDLADVRVYDRQHQLFILNRRRTCQTPKGCRLVVAGIISVRRGNYCPHCPTSLVSAVHTKHMADCSYTKLVFVSKIETVEAINKLRRTRQSNFVGMPVENIKCHGAE